MRYGVVTFNDYFSVFMRACKIGVVIKVICLSLASAVYQFGLWNDMYWSFVSNEAIFLLWRASIRRLLFPTDSCIVRQEQLPETCKHNFEVLTKLRPFDFVEPMTDAVTEKLHLKKHRPESGWLFASIPITTTMPTFYIRNGEFIIKFLLSEMAFTQNLNY
jgi:predicted glutamine amidotransferase